MSGSWEPFGPSNDPEPEPPVPAASAAPAVPPADPPPEPRSAAASLPRTPARRLAVLTCMDSRLDPLRDLGLERGDAMVMRNAGAQVSDDMERSLRFVADTLGVEEIWIVGHSDCAAHGGVDSDAQNELRRGMVRLRGVLPGVSVRLRFYDLETGAVRPVEGPG
jgi:uncharacterized protein YjiS (DUF1127 family)